MPKSKETTTTVQGTSKTNKNKGSERGNGKPKAAGATKPPKTVSSDDVGVKKNKKRSRKRPISRFNSLAFSKLNPYSRLRKTGRGMACRCGPMTRKNAIVSSMEELTDRCGYNKKSPFLAISRFAVARFNTLVIKYALNLKNSSKYPLNEGELRSIEAYKIPMLVQDFPNKITSDNNAESTSHAKFVEQYCNTPLNLTSTAKEIANVAAVISGQTFLKKCIESVENAGGATLNTPVASAVLGAKAKSGLGPSLSASFLKLADAVKARKGEADEDMICCISDDRGKIDPCTYYDCNRTPTLGFVMSTEEMVLPKQ